MTITREKQFLFCIIVYNTLRMTTYIGFTFYLINCILHQKLKCGYCGYIMHGSCGNALAHHCFSKFNEKLHVIAVDNNMVVTMRKLKYFHLICISVVIYRTSEYNI